MIRHNVALQFRSGTPQASRDRLYAGLAAPRGYTDRI